MKMVTFDSSYPYHIKMIHIAVFASGSGTNAENIAKYFSNAPDINISLILSNNPDAYVIERAKKMGVPCYVFSRQEFYESENVLSVLHKYEISFLVLAGFLWLVPAYLLRAYPDRIINIHPALLPKYGGKGFYGNRVHKAVKESGDKETGITIHLVNENYDEGRIIFQEKIEIGTNDTVDIIAKKVHELEYKHYPRVIREVINNC